MRSYKRILISGLFLSTSILFAQPPDTLWTKTYGGSSNERGSSVQQTSDGGYIITGCTQSYGAGSWDVWLIKTDSLGNKEWDKTFGGMNEDHGLSVQQTSDSGYIITGCTKSYGADSCDVWLIKTDSLGNKEWDKTFGGIDDDQGWSVQQTSDGGYIIVGNTQSYGAGSDDVWLIKTDSLGNKEWDKTFGGTSWEYGHWIQQTSDDGYIITGSARSYSYTGQFWLIKTDSLGNKEWDKTFGEDPFYSYGRSVQQTFDCGYIITGYTGNINFNVWLIKTDSLGNKEWDTRFGGGYEDYGYSVRQTSEGGYIIAGHTQSYGAGNYDFWLIKTDSLGNYEWDRTFGGINDDLGYSVQQTSEGGYVVAGHTGSFGAGGYDVWLIKLEPDIGVEEEITKNLPHHWSSTIISGPLRLPKGKKCKVYDISGRAVNVNRIKPGIYFIEIEGKISQKVVKIK